MFTSGLMIALKSIVPFPFTCSVIRNRSSPVSQSERIATSFETCCSIG